MGRPARVNRGQVLSAAREAFVERGYEGATLSDIAGRVGVSAAALLRNSLQSFSSFVPLDVVRELVRSGHPLTLGVAPRELTVFFSDLENFSTHAEQMAPNELLEQMSIYFEQVSQAISQEEGTVDKFIGDGVMAFWGAPVARADHARRSRAAGLGRGTDSRTRRAHRTRR